jgi:hypothetical protein
MAIGQTPYATPATRIARSSFVARSLALDFVRRSPECVSACALPVLGRKAPIGPPRVHHVVVEWRWIFVVIQSCEPVVNWARDNHLLTSSQS